MLRFAIRRLVLLVPILLGLSILLFGWVRALPGGPAQALLGEHGSPAAARQVRIAYGLDRPLYVQYWSFLKRAVRLNFGTSIRTNHSVTSEFLTRFPMTVELTVSALIFAVGLGIPLGYLAARRHGQFLDHASVVGSLIGVTIPVFFLAFLLKYLVAIKLGWLPPSGRSNERVISTHPTNFYVLDGLLTREYDASWDAIKHLILPAVALGSIPLAIIVRITRAAVIDVSNEDYVRTAEAKGLAGGTVSRRHILRNALLPVATTIGLQTGLLLSGAILTETVFDLPGIGSFVYQSIRNRDYPVLQGFILIIAVIYVLVNLLVDLSYGLIDPRVRVGNAGR
ncbi:MAG TPA: ABC transporter permease [Mycobacteriales bacterium]|nr:ABC transporter permease [Mycobacteriales bacterium]